MIVKARAALGVELGGYSATDLLCDNMPNVSVDEAGRLADVVTAELELPRQAREIVYPEGA